MSDLTATVTAALLRLLGYDAFLAGTEILEPAVFVYRIDYRCTSAGPILIFAALVATDSDVVRPRMPWLAAGICLLLSLSIVRLVSLYIAGVHARGSFDLLHEYARLALTL